MTSRSVRVHRSVTSIRSSHLAAVTKAPPWHSRNDISAARRFDHSPAAQTCRLDQRYEHAIPIRKPTLRISNARNLYTRNMQTRQASWSFPLHRANTSIYITPPRLITSNCKLRREANPDRVTRRAHLTVHDRRTCKHMSSLVPHVKGSKGRAMVCKYSRNGKCGRTGMKLVR